MPHAEPNNVYKGPDAIKHFFDPDRQPPLPLVELPAKLNPFAADGVRIFAKLLTALPAQNVKALPALNMLLHEPSAESKRIVEASSGSTVTSLAITSRVLYENADTTAFCTNKTELNRLRQLQFFGIKVELYGGPAQPEFTDPRGIIERVRKLARSEQETLNPAQYDNENNWKAHQRWTGPQLWQQIPEINLFCMGMGSTGCITGTGSYLKAKKPSVRVLGVCNAERDPIPGPRALPLFDSCSFPWKPVVDDVESISSVDAYRLSMNLSRNGIIAGPSSGMALQGLFDFLAKIKSRGELGTIRDPVTAEACCVFVCCDLPYQYLDGYFQRLNDDDFHPIVNQELLMIDQLVYDLKWEIDLEEKYRSIPDEVKNLFCARLSTQHDPHTPNVTCPSPLLVIDLRHAEDYDVIRLQGSCSMPLEHLHKETVSPFDFDDNSELRRQWVSLNALFCRESVSSMLVSHGTSPVIILDYDGDTARMATAILRAKNHNVYSVMGGMSKLAHRLERL